MKHVAIHYLWKEWRDQRATLGWLAAALFVAAGAGMFLTPARLVVASPPLFLVAMVLTFLAVLLTVGSDLLPGEVVRKRVGFLERLPSGLNGAFAAKIFFFAAVSLAAIVYGVLLVSLFAALRTGALPEQVIAEETLPALATFFAFALWTFTISAWVPRSALAFPATAIFLSLLCWPFWLIVLQDHWYLPRSWEIPGIALLCLISAPFAAWASFARGYRFGRTSRQAAWRSIVVGILFVSPAWAWTGQRIHQIWTIDPGASDFRIRHCVIGKEQRHAFISAYREAGPACPSHAMVVDLETGEWRSEGTGEWMLLELPASRDLMFPGPSEVWVGEGASQRCFEAITGKPLPASSDPGFDSGLPTASELGLVDGWEVRGWAGLGYQTLRRSDSEAWEFGFYDPFREEHVLRSEIAHGSHLPSWGMNVRPGRWVCWVDQGWALFDPEYRTWSEPRGIDDAVHLGLLSIVADGRVLVATDDGVALVDPETGAREECSLSFDPPGPIRMLNEVTTCLSLGSLFTLSSGPEWSTFARFDAPSRSLQLARSDDHSRFANAVSYDETSVIVAREDRLVRQFFDGREPEILFPRTDR